MASWTPQPAGLQEILQTIRGSTDTNKDVQGAITLKLDAFTRVSDYVAYLAHILASSQEDQIRTIAGYLLKNNARQMLDASIGVAEYAKAAVLSAFSNSSPLVRNAAGQVIVAFLGVLEPRNWPDCLGQLVIMLDDPARDEAAFNVLQNACEDFPQELDIEINGNRPLDFMIPKFLMLSEHPSPKMRSHAIACLSYFVPINSRSLYAHIDNLFTCLFKRASDEDPSVRRRVCQAFVSLLAAWPDKLIPEMANVAEYMLYSTKDKNENVALEACEFWLKFAKGRDFAPVLRPLLGRVAPVLLDCMIYGEDELLWLEQDMQDTTVPDKETDMKPRHYGAKSHGLERDEAAEDTAKRDAYGEEMIDEDEDDFADGVYMGCTVRRCAAAALDALAAKFGAELMNVLLSPLKAKLWTADWLQRESAIFALGVITEGGIDSLEEHLRVLIPYLLHMLSDPRPLIRSITCWTLGRYASWYTQVKSEEHKSLYFIPTMEGLLRMVLDDNKRVQEAGCSAFATLADDAGAKLSPYLEPVLRNLVLAFKKYQHRNMLMLYDAISAVAAAVGCELSDPQYVEILMFPLLERWGKLRNDDDDLIPLLECLSSVAIAAGPGLTPYAEPVFERCISIIHNSLLQYQAYQQSPELNEPDESFLAVSLDLLSGLAKDLGVMLEPAISRSQPSLLSLLTICLKHSQALVRQSAYALIRNLAMGCLQPHLSTVVAELIQQLDPELKAKFVSEVALRYARDHPEFQQRGNALISRLIPILLNPEAPRSLREKAAVLLGRTGLIHPGLVAPYLPVFAQAWCEALSEICDSEEKDFAFRGFCTLVQMNPTGIANSLSWFCHAIVQCNDPSPELNAVFQQLLTGFRNHDVAGWQAQVTTLPPAVQERLAMRYGV